MYAGEPAARITAALALGLQLLLAVGVPFADASHAPAADERPVHIEQPDRQPCSSGHTADCQLARALGSSGLPLAATATVALVRAAAPLVSNPDAGLPHRGTVIPSGGPRAPPLG